MNFRDLSCFEHVSWRPSRAELRGFAVSMAVGFLLIGLLVAWRRHDLGAPTFALWGIGAALALAALVPGLGRAAYLAVLVPTGLLGYVTSRVLLTLIFILVFTPLALVLRAMGKDALQLRTGRGSSWWCGHDGPPASERYYRQF